MCSPEVERTASSLLPDISGTGLTATGGVISESFCWSTSIDHMFLLHGFF